MKKWVCQVCGYIYEGENPPEECPVCHVGAEKFEELKGEMVWADEHRIGVAQGVDEQVVEEFFSSNVTNWTFSWCVFSFIYISTYLAYPFFHN